MSHKIIDYVAPPTVAQFIASEKRRAFIFGPIGSGKSVGGIMKMMYRAQRQEPDSDGVRPTRWVVVRNTWEELKRTTFASFKDWFPPGKAGEWKASDKTFFMNFGLPDGTHVQTEFLWMGLDTPEDTDELLSLELTGIHFDECVLLPREIIDGGFTRCGRYPKKAQVEASWSGVTGSSNVGDVNSWWYDYLHHEIVEDPIKAANVDYFLQPGARTSKRENYENLPTNYYEDMEDNTEAFKKQFLDCIWLPGKGGQAVHPTFSRNIHVSPHELVPNPTFPLLVGLDPGVSYAGLTFAQYDHMNHRVFFYDPSKVLEDYGAERIVDEIVNPLLNTRFRHVAGRVLWCMDPAARNRSAADERSAAKVIRDKGFQITFETDNSIRTRLDAVDKFLSKITPSGPALVIDPRCKVLIEGFEHGYRYKLDKRNVRGEVPEKGYYSHVMDAGQYVCQNAAKSLMAIQRHSGTAVGYTGPTKNIYRT